MRFEPLRFALNLAVALLPAGARPAPAAPAPQHFLQEVALHHEARSGSPSGAITEVALAADGSVRARAHGRWLALRAGGWEEADAPAPGPSVPPLPAGARLAQLAVSPAGDHVACRPAPDTPPDSVEHLLLDQVLPFLIARRGHTVIHGSAVALRGLALAFCGPSGRGKSTLATAFVNRGARILTDDCLALQPTPAGFLVLPSYPGVRLWDDSFHHLAPGARSTPVSHYSAKRRVALPAAAPVPLRRLFFLDSGPSFRIAPLAGPQLFQTLPRTQFLLDTEDPAELQSALARTAALARAGLCFQLTLPRGLDQLPRWVDLISNQSENG